MEFENLIKLIQTVSDSGLTELKYEEDRIKIVLSKKTEKMQVISRKIMQPDMTQLDYAEATAQNTEEQHAAVQEGHIIASPLVGIFYAAPSENAQPFVEVGDQVEKGQILGIVEAMKLMNDIECECNGTVAEILVENGQPVEYGQPLFRIV